VSVDGTTPTAYCTRTHRVIDFVKPGETNEAALARLAEYGRDLVILPLDEAVARHEAAFKSEPVEIAETDWNSALNVLPPVRWTRDGFGESFKMSERLTGAITAIYVQLNGRYFSFNDDIRMPHAECCRRVFHSQAYRQRPVAEIARLADDGQERQR
jgi:hypothetical protein